MKFLRYLVLITFCIIWAIGLSPFLVNKLMHDGVIEDGYHYGDLYRLSNLSQFQDPRKACIGYTPPPKPQTSKKSHLYVIGDSFTEDRVGKQDFSVDEYTFVHWRELLHIKLDTTETNIMLMESVERHFRQKSESRLNILIPDTATFVTKVPAPKFAHRLDNAFAANFTQDRLDALLFQNDLFLTIKEWKADFNRYVFGRVNSGVTLVNNGQDVVYYMDTDTTITSSFNELDKYELDSIVMNVNETRDYLDSLGFQHVILSIIPNKVSVINPEYGEYNRLIERVYSHPKLGVPYIDVLPEFRKMGNKAYQNGDSHWTCEGQYLWLDKANALIRKLLTGDSV
ncbi:hypothetical protein [Dyadobacter sp. CY323]|uniref:hypothetical protein n=1 Tax=Dyadobacter sp. CY323 TaxID=2907302 RepID=UPI001F2349CD|nr:hypothetical protein [Dyadobacter sp. CY323]MCE6991665.1 hypothetical protein [Dyadobacter sp. CY323]